MRSSQTSKGAAGVSGSGFIVLAATLSAVGDIPVAGLALILGVDRSKVHYQHDRQRYCLCSRRSMGGGIK